MMSDPYDDQNEDEDYQNEDSEVTREKAKIGLFGDETDAPDNTFVHKNP